MSNNHQAVPINGARLRAARLALGMGTREFARAAGVTFTVVDTAEKHDTLATSSTVADARRLAAVAGLALTDLLLEPVSRHDTETDLDVQRLAAALGTDRRMVNTEDLAVALGWTLNEVHRTAKALDRALEPAGLRIHQISGQMTLRPRHPEAQQIAECLAQRRSARDGLNVTSARMLYEALSGDSTDSPTAAERPALGNLVNLGLLRPGRRKDEPFHVVTDAARLGFRQN